MLFAIDSAELSPRPRPENFENTSTSKIQISVFGTLGNHMNVESKKTLQEEDGGKTRRPFAWKIVTPRIDLISPRRDNLMDLSPGELSSH